MSTKETKAEANKREVAAEEKAAVAAEKAKAAEPAGDPRSPAERRGSQR